MAITTQSLNQGLGTEGSGAPTVHEIFTRINNAKDKPAKIAILKQFDNQAMRQLLKAAFDPKIKFDLPEGNPPFIRNEAPAGTEHTSLASEAKKLFHFVVGGNNTINKSGDGFRKQVSITFQSSLYLKPRIDAGSGNQFILRAAWLVVVKNTSCITNIVELFYTN